MRIEPVEIYSDETNAAVMRHPGRRFPGILVQGDTLWTLCSRADEACKNGRSVLDDETYQELNSLRNSLWGLLTHYKETLGAHDVHLPFSETPARS
jgi:hypothetical protein